MVCGAILNDLGATPDQMFSFYSIVLIISDHKISNIIVFCHFEKAYHIAKKHTTCPKTYHDYDDYHNNNNNNNNNKITTLRKDLGKITVVFVVD